MVNMDGLQEPADTDQSIIGNPLAHKTVKVFAAM